MNLIEVYIDEVTRRLPERSRKDIALELRSTIEDMLPDDYSEVEIKQVLSQLGNPAVLASGYRDQPMHLIGPRYFDMYINLLKMILPIAAIVSLISLFAQTFIDYNGNDTLLMIIINSIGIGIWGIISTGIQVFFWLTLIFAIIERVDTGKSQLPLTTSLKEWTPDDLKDIPFIPKKKAISKVDVFGGLLWTAIWATVYFNAAHLAGVYENGKNGLEFVIPTFNQEILQSYWPLVVLVIGLEISVALYKWFASQWTMKVALLNATWQLIATIVFIVIFRDPDLFNTAFVDYMHDLFSIKNDLSIQIIGSAIMIVVVFAVIDIIQGFRKARI
jgi:hypothetical protein